MKKALLIVNAAVGAALLTLVTAVLTLLVLMFSTGEESVRREGLFGSVFFETTEVREGVTGASMGVDNLTGLVVVFVVLFLFLVLTQVAYRGLKVHRARLIEEQAGGRHQAV
ncbi:hypothetical protein [Quadrisphaera sp. DSM 44207]|uniref:hypothetical protein n=1 Tax=Quadrisphaera sp. DSM 44207 TaxID=1881057 RepID=UPI0008906410|nr:hypothetical protein [Quadrisphaera sp. DSM 44207]SDQ72446.1 hypothetical protein SAMN05428996_2552 [Quadrisphaera sp. DSM 44207]